MKLDVLDKGHVELLDHMGGDKAVIRSARECYQTESGIEERDNALIKRIVTGGHTSVLEHAVFQFHVKLPLFVRDQWVRHRVGWSYSIRSFRYTEASPEFYNPGEWRFDTAFDEAMTFYKELLAGGWKREHARIVVPTGLYTSMVATCNARSLMHFLELRTSPHAQEEIRKYAEALGTLAATVAPVTMAEILKKIKNN